MKSIDYYSKEGFKEFGLSLTSLHTPDIPTSAAELFGEWMKDHAVTVSTSSGREGELWMPYRSAVDPETLAEAVDYARRNELELWHSTRSPYGLHAYRLGLLDELPAVDAYLWLREGHEITEEHAGTFERIG